MTFSYITVFSSFLLGVFHNLIDISAIVQVTQLIWTEERYIHTTIPARDRNTPFTTTDIFRNTAQLANT